VDGTEPYRRQRLTVAEGKCNAVDYNNPFAGTQFTADTTTKAAILRNGGGTLELAIPMQETDNLLNSATSDISRDEAASAARTKASVWRT
jgi:hypothetical protein